MSDDEKYKTMNVLAASDIRKMLKALKEFGYETLTEEEVKIQANKALMGVHVDVGPGMMIRDMLKDAKWIK